MESESPTADDAEATGDEIPVSYDAPQNYVPPQNYFAPQGAPPEEFSPEENPQLPYALPSDVGPGGPDGPLASRACPPPRCLPMLEFFGLRHSYTDGRNVGWGWPLVGTSWLNRPYYIGGTIGVLGVANRIQPEVRPDVDTFGGFIVGWDWDYYWGSEIQIERATPELTNRDFPDVVSGNRMMLWSYQWMYYPWGDSLVRPFWRLGVGSTDVDFVNDSGHRRDELLWTFPVGVGVKYPIRRFLAARIEFTDHFVPGNRGVSTLNDLTLTFGLEWHFGARPPSYWPWNPSPHIW
jgi:outer membrane protein with beta-barrel domain